MDSMDIFRKLTQGIKWDYKKFGTDLERLKIIPRREVESKEQIVSKDILTLDDNPQNCNSHKRKRCGNQRGSKKSKNEELPQEISASNLTLKDQNQSVINVKEDEVENEEEDVCLIGNVKLSLDKANTTARRRKMSKRKEQKLVPEKIALMNQERVNEIRNKKHIHVKGTDIPDPLVSFEEMQSSFKVNPKLLQNIKSAGFEVPTPIEMQAMPVMLRRRELMACAPTGSGKTLAFVLPILHELKQPCNKGIRALVLAPTRELANQTYVEFCRMGEGTNLRAHLIHKTGQYEKSGNNAFLKYDIIVTTPNRLLYLLSKLLISLSSVEWLVVDESDKLFEDGKTGFRDQLATIYKACDSPFIRRAMFSATFSSEVEEWCRLNLDNVVQVDIGARNAATHTIEQKLLYVGCEAGKLISIRDIFRKEFAPPVLVFVQSKERAKELYHELLYDEWRVNVIHADLTETQRDDRFASFRRGETWVLISTDVMGRGIDFKGVNLVINYDFPNSAVSYIHRIGRTGRAGRPGKAVTFFSDEDTVNLRSIVNVMREAGCEVPEHLLRLKAPGRKRMKKLAKTTVLRETISTDIRKKVISAKKLAFAEERQKKKNMKKKNKKKKKLQPETVK